MSTDTRPSPLLHPVLQAIGDGATPAEVESSLGAWGVTARDGLVEATVEEAAGLGLVRVASRSRTSSRYVLTSLGQRFVTGDAMTQHQAERLRDLEALRTDLSATIAHELRTPLTAIRTCASLLLSEDARPTEEQHRALVETIERNAERMQRVVGDILDLARFRAGSIALQLRRFDVVTMSEDVIASLEPVTRDRGIVVRVSAAHRPVAVYADHRRLEQALVNLVSNALRFSPDGGDVRVGITRVGQEARLTVEDDGPGIAPDDQRRLFERFFVGRSDRGGSRDGVGLGLPTALAIAQAHGGRIEVESALGAGSSFALVIPLDGPDGALDDD
jgi:signal transduction histidine kinase